LGNGAGVGPFGFFTIKGALTLDSKSTINYDGLTPGAGPTPVPGTSYNQLTATGAAALNSATLGSITADCGQKIGTTYTLIAAKGGLTGTFGNAANGSVVQAQKAGDLSCSVSTAVAPYLKLTYNDTAGTLTAKVVAAPAGPAVSATPSAGPVWRLQSAGGVSWATTEH
jgi:hypothetical protein